MAILNNLTKFFSCLPSALEKFLDNPEKGHADINRISKIFFMPENVSLSDASALVKKPR